MSIHFVYGSIIYLLIGLIIARKMHKGMWYFDSSNSVMVFAWGFFVIIMAPFVVVEVVGKVLRFLITWRNT